MRYSGNRTIDLISLLPFVGLLCCVLIPDNVFTGTGKAVGFYITISLIPLAVSLSYANNRQPVKYHINDLLLFMLVLLALGISYLNHPVINNKMVILVLLLVLYYCFRIFLVQHPVNLYVLTLAFMLTGLAEAWWGMLQLYGYIPSRHYLFRATGSFFNPGPYAGYLAMVLPIALYYFLRDREIAAAPSFRKVIYYRLRRGLALATCVSILLILPATMSRAAWLAGFAGCLAVIGLYLWKVRKPSPQICFLIKRSKRRLAAVMAVVMLVTAGALAGLYYLKKDSADGRLLIWKISAEIAERHWLGWGIGYFPGIYGEEQRAYFASERGTEQEQWVAGSPEYAFNEFIQLAVEMGMLPLILLLVSLVCTMTTTIRARRFAIVGSLVALLVIAGMSYPFSLISFAVMLVFLIASGVSVPYAFDPEKDSRYEIFEYHVRRRWNGYTIIGLLVLLQVLTACCWWNRYPVYVAHKAWGKAELYYDGGAYEKVAETYGGLFPYLRDQPGYLFQYGQSLLKTGQYDESIRVLSYGTAISSDPMFHILIGKNHQEKQLYRLAERYFQDAAQMVPHRLYPYYLLSKLYDEAGDTEKGADMAAYVVGKPAKVDSPAVQEMKTEMRKRLRSGQTE